jgi:hypothetical protein
MLHLFIFSLLIFTSCCCCAASIPAFATCLHVVLVVPSLGGVMGI